MVQEVARSSRVAHPLSEGLGTCVPRPFSFLALFRTCNFRLRRILDLSPMVEVWWGLVGLLTSVFGEGSGARRWWRFGSCFPGMYPPSSANPGSVADGGGWGIPWGSCNFRHIGTKVSAYSLNRRCARRHVVVSNLVPVCLISMVVFVEGRRDDTTEPDAAVGNIRFVFLARKKQPA